MPGWYTSGSEFQHAICIFSYLVVDWYLAHLKDSFEGLVSGNLDTVLFNL